MKDNFALALDMKRQANYGEYLRYLTMASQNMNEKILDEIEAVFKNRTLCKDPNHSKAIDDLIGVYFSLHDKNILVPKARDRMRQTQVTLLFHIALEHKNKVLIQKLNEKYPDILRPLITKVMEAPFSPAAQLLSAINIRYQPPAFGKAEDILAKKTPQELGPSSNPRKK